MVGDSLRSVNLSSWINGASRPFDDVASLFDDDCGQECCSGSWFHSLPACATDKLGRNSYKRVTLNTSIQLVFLKFTSKRCSQSIRLRTGRKSSIARPSPAITARDSIAVDSFIENTWKEWALNSQKQSMKSMSRNVLNSPRQWPGNSQRIP